MKVEILNLPFIKNMIKTVTKKVTSLKSVWPEVRDEFYKIEQKRFDTQNQGRWRPLNPVYALWKQKKYPGKPIMIRTGKLEKTLTSITNGTIYEPHRREVKLGTKVSYAIYHQHGTRERGSGAGQSRLPPRPLISLTKKDRNKFQKIIDKYLDRVVGRFK